MKKAIVTGANGFVGRWLLAELLKKNVKVIAVVRNRTSDISELPQGAGLKIVYCDSKHIEDLTNVDAAHGADCFYHLAWQGSTGTQRGDYNMQLDCAKYTADAALTAHLLGCGRFVGAGTLAELDCGNYIPRDGSAPNMVSCYGTAKIAAHYMSKAICCKNGTEHLWVHIPNSYGEGDRSRNFINHIALSMLKGVKFPLTSGEQLYEFVYIGDIAAGLYSIGNSGKPFCCYYIGGMPRQLKEYVLEVRDRIDPGISLALGEIPFNGNSHAAEVFDGAKLKNDIGFALSVPFSDGIRRTLEWLRNELIQGHFI